jgi:hypothetical protein
MRDGAWLLVEYYDEDRTELYNLADDPGEKRDLAGRQHERVASMKAALEDWRRANNAQRNTPNPDFDEEKFRKLYVDIDAGTFDPLSAGPSDWACMLGWREDMNQLAPWKQVP